MLVAAVIMSHPLQHIILKFFFDGIGTYREGWGVNIYLRDGKFDVVSRAGGLLIDMEVR